MTKTKAIRRARERVRLVSYGKNQWTVYTWSPKHNATWMSHMMEHARAAAYAREIRIREALTFLGVDDPDVEAMVLADREGRWDDLVREFRVPQ